MVPHCTRATIHKCKLNLVMKIWCHQPKPNYHVLPILHRTRSRIQKCQLVNQVVKRTYHWSKRHLIATAPSVISIAYNECAIISLPLATVESMWSKVEEYLKSDCDIVPAPGSDHKAKMVSSHSSNTPHFVRALHLGQSVCDSNCFQWKSAQICSHITAVAEKNGELHSFLEW